MEEAQQKLDEAEHAGRGGGGSTLSSLRRGLAGLASPAFLEALTLTFIGGALPGRCTTPGSARRQPASRTACALVPGHVGQCAPPSGKAWQAWPAWRSWRPLRLTCAGRALLSLWGGDLHCLLRKLVTGRSRSHPHTLCPRPAANDAQLCGRPIWSSSRGLLRRPAALRQLYGCREGCSDTRGVQSGATGHRSPQ